MKADNIKTNFSRFLSLFKNKYLVSICFFLIWILFFDHNNLLDRAHLIKNVKQLESDRDYYIERIEIDSTRLTELRSSNQNLEKFAREQYLMKKDDEDIFVIVEK